MFRFSRELILPLVLAKRTGITELARRAGVNPKTFFPRHQRQASRFGSRR